MSGRLGTSIKIGLGFVVSAICLWLAIRNAPISELSAAATQVNWAWVAVAGLTVAISLWARGCRWKVLLGGRGTSMEYFWAQSIGSLLTNVFPLRAGEAGRVVIVSRQVGIPLVQVGASLVLERAVDLAVILTLMTVLLLVMDVPWQVTATGLALGAAMAVAWIGVVVLLIFGGRLTGLVESIADRLPGRFQQLALDSWSHLLVALDPLRDVRVVGQIVLWSVLIWAMGVGGFWAAIEAVVPGAGPIEPAFALVAVALGVALPSSPGFIGVFHLIGQQALAAPFPERYNDTQAVLIAILNHAAYYLTSTLLGVIGLARLGISLGAVRHAAPTAEAEAAPTRP
ncbi:MAG: flippase-like domain-containing protein [Chloroflexi bacterium]|nr:flippase-like domain-containing protein [Chloroflexota bacterium]